MNHFAGTEEISVLYFEKADWFSFKKSSSYNVNIIMATLA